jgi:hypothetical protein
VAVREWLPLFPEDNSGGNVAAPPHNPGHGRDRTRSWVPVCLTTLIHRWRVRSVHCAPPGSLTYWTALDPAAASFTQEAVSLKIGLSPMQMPMGRSAPGPSVDLTEFQTQVRAGNFHVYSKRALDCIQLVRECTRREARQYAGGRCYRFRKVITRTR